VHVQPGGAIPAAELSAVAARAHDSLSTALGTSLAPVMVVLHATLDSFRAATGRPWWVSAAATGTTINLAPAPLLAQREGLDVALRIGMAELMVRGALQDRPAWVRVGAARYFAKPALPPRSDDDVRCPSDAELTVAVSATSQREAEARAEACFARAYARTGDWRAVR
jgi:hypothetical protein